MAVLRAETVLPVAGIDAEVVAVAWKPDSTLNSMETSRFGTPYGPDTPVVTVSAQSDLGSGSPRLLLAWLAAAEAEAAAAVGDGPHAQRQLDKSYGLLDGEGAAELPFLMLDESHFARWRGHCLARLGEQEAIEDLTRALDSVGDSVRAATGLYVDLAHAYHLSGQVDEARAQIKTAVQMAGQYGSHRQQNRLRALLPAAER